MPLAEVCLSKSTHPTISAVAIRVAILAIVPKAINVYETAENPAAIAAKGSCEWTWAVGLQPDAMAATMVVSEKGLQ